MRFFQISVLVLIHFVCLCLWAADASKIHVGIIEVSSLVEAQTVRTQLQSGVDFAELAKQKSSDATAKDGGDMGQVDPAQLRRELREALKGLRQGELSEVVKLSSSYAVLKVLPPVSPGTQKTSQSATIAMAGYGNVRASANIGGLLEAELAFQNFDKPIDWGQDVKGICRIRKDSLETNKAMLRQYLATAKEGENGVRAVDIMQMHFALAQLYTYEGFMAPAQRELALMFDMALQKSPASLPQVVEALGTNQMHSSEVLSGVYSAPGERCLVPVTPSSLAAPLAGIEVPIKTFQGFLRHVPEDLEVKWLLNLSYMYKRDYPTQVPPEFLISPAHFNSKQAVGRFHDVAPAVGLNHVSMAGGVIVDDFDGDGLLDIVKSSFDMCEHLYYFKNNGDGTFTERSSGAGFDDQLGGLNIIQADYDNDGCLDVLVLRGGWEWPMRRSLLKGNCKGSFTDVTLESGLATPVAASQSAVWIDINNDGFLDLFTANERGMTQLFLNKRNGTFQEVGQQAGVARSTFTKGVASADYDNDGWPDLYVSNLYADNLLYHNNRDGTFTEVAAAAGVQMPLASFATWFFDYDNDGWQDLFVTSYYMSTDEAVRSLTRLPVNAETLKLYRNRGDGTFEDVTVAAGLDRVLMPMGGNFGDFDNDGYLDMYMGSGSPSLVALVPYVLWHNDSGKRFYDVSTSAGVGELHKGHGVSFADLKNKGQADILTIIGGAVPTDAHAMRLFESPPTDNNWLSVTLKGVRSNRSAIGAKISVTVENSDGSVRKVNRVVGSGGSFGASPLRQQIGLGHDGEIRELEIQWPASGTLQRFNEVPVNQFIQIEEFSKTYSTLKLKTFQYRTAQQ